MAIKGAGFEERLRRLLPLLAATMILGSQMLVRPIVGLPDNGDFINVTGPFELAPATRYEEGRYFLHVVPFWEHAPKREPFAVRLLTSEWLVLLPSIAITRTLLGGIFDLRWAGMSHLLIVLLAAWVIRPVVERLKPRWQVVVWLSMLLVLGDVAYATHMNSLYMDAASFVFLLLAVACYARLAALGREERWVAIAFLAASLLFITSKLQHAYLLPALLVMIAVDPRIRKGAPRWLLAGGAALMAAGVALMFWHVPADYKTFAAYNVVFMDLVPNAKDPSKVLEEFHLPRELARQSGRSGFDPNSALRDEKYRPVLLEQIHHGSLLRYYLRHPDDAIRLTEKALIESSRERERGYGNFANDTGYAARQTARAFAVYSNAKRALFQLHPWRYAIFQLAVMLGAIAAAWYWFRPGLVGVVMLCLMAGFEFMSSALGDCADTTRHTFLFRAMVDVLLVGGVAMWAGSKTERGAIS